MHPPRRPQKGEEIPDDWWLDFFDYVLSLQARGDLSTTVVRRDKSGTVISAPRRNAATNGQRGDTIIAQIDTDHLDGTYSATEQKNAAGTFSDRTLATGMIFDSGNNGVLREIHGRIGVPVGAFVEVMRVLNTDGGPIWYFIDDSAPSGTAQDASFTGNHTEAARTSTAWNRASQGGLFGTKRTVCTGVEYNDAGDKVIYAYYEDWTFDADGHLLLISAERRETVETPEECAATTTTTTTTSTTTTTTT